MILMWILDFVFNILETVFSWLNIPTFPAEVNSLIVIVVNFISRGINFVACFIDPAILTVGLSSCIAVIGVYVVCKIIGIVMYVCEMFF